MQLFVLTAHCKSRAHCQTCRDLAGGRKWRESLAENFELPNNQVDFTCPYDVPWNAITSPSTKGNEYGINDSSPHKPTDIPPEQPRTGERRGGCGCGRNKI